jgi:hypothetical protein
MRRYLLSALLALAALAASAADLSAGGFTVTGTRTIEGNDYRVLVDQSGKEILYSSDFELTADVLSTFRSVVAALRSWKSFDIASIWALAEQSDRLRITLVLSRFESQGLDLTTYVPGGLQFFLTKGSTEFDFRLKSGKYFLRLKGLLTTEEDLVGEVYSASKDPVAYLANRDPQYAIRRITEVDGRTALVEGKAVELETRTTALEGRATSVEGRATDSESRAEGLSAAIADLDTKTASKDGDLEQSIVTLGADLDAALAAKGDELAQSIADLDSKSETALKDFDLARGESEKRLEAALMAALNKGLFGGPKPIDPIKVDKLIELKLADPSLTKALAAAALKAAAVTMSSKEIGIVFLVKFGEP